MIQFFVILPTVCIVDWIGCGSEYTELSWIGLDWVIKLLDWVGLDLAKWTHVQLCCSNRLHSQYCDANYRLFVPRNEYSLGTFGKCPETFPSSPSSVISFLRTFVPMSLWMYPMRGYSPSISQVVGRCWFYVQILFMVDHEYFHAVVSIFYLFSSPNLSGRRLDVYQYFHTWCGLSVNLEGRSETCCARLAGNTGRKKSPKSRHLSGYIFAIKARIDNRKKLVLFFLA